MIWTHAAAALVALAAGFAGGWQVRAWKADADDLDRVELEQLDRQRRAEAADRAASSHETFKAATQARERVIYREVRRVASDPAMQRECIPDAGLRILSEDIAARVAGEPAAAVPTASGPE